MHRLWYDLRTQSMLEQPLREAVTMIDATLQAMTWRVVSHYAELAGRRTSLPPATADAVLDGIFQSTLLAHLAGRDHALDDVAAQVRSLMPLMLAPA